VNYQSQQWLWDGGADALAAVSGAGANTIYATASVRYQFDRQLGIGVAGSVRNDAGTAWSAQTFVEKQSGLGNTRLQLNSAAQERSQRATQLMLDHSWPTPIGTRLTTALSASQETAFGRTFNTAGFLIYGGGDLASNLTLDGNLRFNYTRNVGSGTGFFANVNLAWRIDPRWSVIATVYDNRDDTAKLYVIDSPAQGFASVPTQQSRAFFLTLRYEARAGLPEMPLGGARGAAAGTVAGYIYLDQNDNGRRDASESAAPSVTVLLDGRFSTRTDEHGRFEFPLVAAGTHALTVVPDNLPLPWAVPNGGRVNITVHTRETTPVEIAASRLM
jgi:hypothetical protein